MMKPALKIGPLPDRTPVKISLLIDPALRTELEAYCSAYADAYGERLGVEVLIPVMLEAFLTSDAGFRRIRKQKPLNRKA